VSLRIFSHGWHSSLIGDYADISYFMLAFPFLFASISLTLLQESKDTVGEKNV